MKNVGRARMYVLLFMFALAAIQAYLSVYYYTYSPLIVELGEQHFDHILREYVVIINCAAVVAHVACLTLYCSVLNNNDKEELQRRLTLVYAIVGTCAVLACIVLAAVFSGEQYVLVTCASVGALVLFSTLLCCDCWRERNDLPPSVEEGDGQVEMAVVAVSPPPPLQDQVTSVRASLAQIEAENAQLAHQLRQDNSV